MLYNIVRKLCVNYSIIYYLYVFNTRLNILYSNYLLIYKKNLKNHKLSFSFLAI